MILIAYLDTGSFDAQVEDPQEHLGEIDYSAYVTFQRYVSVLERIGSVVEINDPATEIDKILTRHSTEKCIFLSFSQPQFTYVHPRCPTVCIFAWQFSSLPDDAWESQCELNLTAALETLGNSIALSGYGADVIAKTLPQRVNVAAIPAPLEGQRRDNAPKAFDHSLVLNAELYDSNVLMAEFGAADSENTIPQAPTELPQWDDVPLTIVFSASNADAAPLLAGFYAAESWGVWSRISAPRIYLPVAVKGPILITLELIAYGENIGRNIRLAVGESVAEIVPTDQPDVYQAQFDARPGDGTLCFSNLDLASTPGGDYRTLGLGIKQLTLSRPEGYKKPLSLRIRDRGRAIFGAAFGRRANDEVEGRNTLDLTGVVYTSVFNPEDSHKNWEDMVTAFCWAFRHEARATLLLKMSHRNTATFLGTLKLLFSTLPAFECRVVAVYGFLNDAEMEAISAATHYVVNSSLCEGQGLSLMEFMARGVPAIAPAHTAMADYINDENAFVVASSLQPGFWPLDECQSFSTLRSRIDWMSLRDAFEQSYRVASSRDSSTYQRMCQNSVRSVTDFAGEDVVTGKLNAYLCAITR